MIRVWREKLPESYLLILEDGPAGPEVPLERALYRAAHSGKEAVWLDCSLLSDLPTEAAEILLAYQQHLPEVGMCLVLSHVSAEVQRQLHAAVVYRESAPPIVASLLEAAVVTPAPACKKPTQTGPYSTPRHTVLQPSQQLTRMSYQPIAALAP
jgi:hypothetical protein